MPADAFKASPERRKLAALIAKIASQNADDPRLPGFRARLDALRVEEIHQWAVQAAAGLPPLTSAEIRSVAVRAREIDRRIREREVAQAANDPDEAEAAS